MKKILSVILILCLILCAFAGCKGKDDNVTTVTKVKTEINKGNLRLAYSKNDSLNPYECETQMNLQISSLVYDSLFVLDNNYKPQPVIAKSAISAGKTVNVTIENVKFSDGTSVTVSDIINSFNLAKDSDVYSTRLANFVSANVTSSNMVMFSLESPDPYAVSCLDFPIIKYVPKVVPSTTASDDEETKEEVEEKPPVGSGKYKYAFDGEHVYLVVNTNKAGFNPVIKTISLISVHDSDSAEGSLVIGNTAFFYDELNEGVFNRLNAQSKDVPLNNLVYLGFNKNNPFFEIPEIRAAINTCIKRANICSVDYCNHARPTALPFNPDWYALNALKTNTDPDFDKAKELVELSEIDPLSRELVLLYNSDNGFKADTAKTIEENLEKLGFIVNLYGVSSEYVASEIKNGHFDLYIGEIKLTKNMNLSSVFEGLTSYDYSPYSDSAIKYNDFVAGSCELMDFINVFNEDIPFVPLCYRNAVVFYTNSMTVGENCYENNVFYDIDTWRTK